MEDVEPTQPPPTWSVDVMLEETPLPPGPANPDVTQRDGKRDELGRLGPGNNVGKQWYKGQPSANPGGRPKAEVSITAELRKRLAAETDDGRALAARVADILVDKALCGDIDALRYLSDRTDGKPVVALTLVDGTSPLHHQVNVNSSPRIAPPADDDD